MANSYDENAQGDSTHANHLTLDLLPSDQVTFSGTFTNYYDPTYGFTTDFDYFQVDLADLDPNGTLTVTFTPQDPNAYYYRILARIDTTENLALPYVLGSNSTWIVRDPVNSEHIDDTTNTAGATISDLLTEGDAIEFQMQGGDTYNPSGPVLYTPLNYQITVTYTPPGGGGQIDLTSSIDRLSAPSVQPGGEVDVRYTTTASPTPSNIQAPTTGIYLSRDRTLSTDDILIGTNSDGLRAELAWRMGESSATNSESVTIPANLAPGTYYIITVANYDHSISESDETNNASAAVPIIVGNPLQRYNGHTYGFIGFNGTAETWSQAEAEATAMGGYLATVTSQGENDFIRNDVLPPGLNGPAAFIGASDATQEGVWKWVTGPEAGTTFWNGEANGSPVPGHYANWATGEPNNAGGNENYAVMGGDGKWVDVTSLRSASFTIGFIAEFNNRACDDLTADGVSDIPYRNDGSGDTWFVAMSNGRFNGWNQIGGSDTRYSIVGVGDFYGAGTSDLLFRSNGTGDTWFEAISNGRFNGWHQIGGSDTHYSVVGVGDFYGTGVDDILFRNNSTGDTWFEAMSNGAATGWHQISGSASTYTVVGVGDFYGNGTDDILFRNNSTGDTWFEAMSDGAFAAWNQIGGSDTHYSVVGVGDFFGNGTDDILFRNNSTGDTWVEAMNNGLANGWNQVGGSDTNYAVAGVGDYFGTGTSDILFRNNSTGDTWFEAISNGGFNSWNQIGGSNTSYSVKT